MSTTPAPLGATPERPPNAAPRASRPTLGDATVPAERVRVTDVSKDPGGRAYLVERGLEEEGPNANAALEALIADYLSVAERLQAIPMAASPPVESDAALGGIDWP